MFFFIVKVGRSWPESLYKQKRKLLGQIWALQPKVRQAFEKLRSSSIFSADMFVKVCRYFTEREILCACHEIVAEKQATRQIIDKAKAGKFQSRILPLQTFNIFFDWCLEVVYRASIQLISFKLGRATIFEVAYKVIGIISISY